MFPRLNLPLLLVSFLALPVMAETVQIKRILNPEWTEVKAASNDEYRLVSELPELTYPIRATVVDNSELLFRQGNASWRIARADVELMGEKLVVDACSTIAAALPGDWKSASVKGAGEGCK